MLIQWLERAIDPIGLTIGRLGRASRATLTAFGVAYATIIGFVQMATTRGMSFDFFYVLGCAFVGWAAGARAGTLTALMSGAFLYLDVVPVNLGFLPTWVVFWNWAIRLMSFIAAGWLAAEVGRLTSTLEETVRERTARLQSEVAEHKATAARLRRSEGQILEISDREQARIGQDIHDGLCQQLIGAAFSANSLQRQLAAAHGSEAALARKLCALLDETITESRRVCYGLYPVRLETEGLVPALEELAASTAERHHVACSCNTRLRSLHCDVTTATHLYRIAQEAVNNALRHSGARHIALDLATAEGCLQLSINDDGKGMPQPSPATKGMGLHIMDYRARSLGGRLDIQSSAAGTVVTCCVPSRNSFI